MKKNVDGAITKYIYDGDQVICETDGAGVITAKYVYGAGIDEVVTMERDGNTYFYHYDGLGNVSDITDETGSVVESYSYDVYGDSLDTSSVGNPYLFNGRRFDSETGLYNYRARYYDPEIGRFLQTDPIGYYDNVNLYSYVNNNPLNWVDPFGLCEKEPWWKSIVPDALTISLSGAAFSQYIVGGGAGVEFVYIFGKGWHIYGQGGIGLGVPGGGANLEIGPIWNLEKPGDYTGPFIEIQGGSTPASGSIFFWPVDQGDLKLVPILEHLVAVCSLRDMLILWRRMKASLIGEQDKWENLKEKSISYIIFHIIGSI